MVLIRGGVLGVEMATAAKAAGRVIKRGVTYAFSSRDLALCQRLAQSRTAANRRKRTRNLNFSRRDDAQIDLQGVCGEYAFLRFAGLGIAPLLDTRCRNATNDTFDATLPSGATVDVKTVATWYCNLAVTTWKAQNPPDVYALCRYDATRETVTFEGAARSDAVCRAERLRYLFDPPRRPYFVMPRIGLRSLPLDDPPKPPHLAAAAMSRVQ